MIDLNDLIWTEGFRPKNVDECILPKKLFILHYPGRLRFLYSFHTQFIPFSENISKTHRKHIENNLISYHICSFVYARI